LDSAPARPPGDDVPVLVRFKEARLGSTTSATAYLQINGATIDQTGSGSARTLRDDAPTSEMAISGLYGAFQLDGTLAPNSSQPNQGPLIMAMSMPVGIATGTITCEIAARQVTFDAAHPLHHIPYDLNPRPEVGECAGLVGFEILPRGRLGRDHRANRSPDGATPERAAAAHCSM